MINFDDTTNFNCAELTNVRLDPLSSLPTYTDGDYNRVVTQGGKLYVGYGGWRKVNYAPTLCPFYYQVRIEGYNISENMYNNFDDLFVAISSALSSSQFVVIEATPNAPNYNNGNYGNVIIDRANTCIILQKGAVLDQVNINAANISIIGEGTINELLIDALATNIEIDGITITGSVIVNGTYTKLNNVSIGNSLNINADNLRADVLAANCSIADTASNVKLNINGLNSASVYVYMLNIYSANNIFITSDAIEQMLIQHNGDYSELIITVKRLGIATINSGGGRLNADVISNSCNGTNYTNAPITFNSTIGRFIINDAVISEIGADAHMPAVLLNDINTKNNPILELQQCYLTATSSTPLSCGIDTKTIIDNCTIVSNSTYSIDGDNSANVYNYGSVANNNYNAVNILVDSLNIDANVI